MARLEGKVALITGGASGIGRATALVFADEGATVAVADCSRRGGEETATLIRSAGGDATFIQADVSKADEVSRMIMTTVATYGRLDILFNNAAIQGPLGFVSELSEEDWDSVLDTDLKSVFLGSKYAIPIMIRQGGGVIINTSSTGGMVGIAQSPAYCAAKAGVIQLTKAMALAHVGENIRVNCICPGGTLTPMMELWMPSDEAGRQAFFQALPRGKPIQPIEIAKAAVFLASDDAQSISGISLAVDAAWTAGVPVATPMTE